MILQQPNIAASLGAFALWCNGGDRVITWGQGDYGGDVSDWASSVYLFFFFRGPSSLFFMQQQKA